MTTAVWPSITLGITIMTMTCLLLIRTERPIIFSYQERLSNMGKRKGIPDYPTVLDRTPIHHWAQLVLLGLVFRRAGPWACLDTRGHIRFRSRGQRVRQRGRHARAGKLGWRYGLRQKGSTLVYIPSLGHWTVLEALATSPEHLV